MSEDAYRKLMHVLIKWRKYLRIYYGKYAMSLIQGCFLAHAISSYFFLSVPADHPVFITNMETSYEGFEISIYFHCGKAHIFIGYKLTDNWQLSLIEHFW